MLKEIFGRYFEKAIYEKKCFKLIAWVFIILMILIVVLYPIIDANFLYYNRTNKRIDIIQKLVNIEEQDIRMDERIEAEYNSILNDMNKQSKNYISNVFQKETSVGKNAAKFFAGSWIFILVAFILPFTKDKNTTKRFTRNNIMAGILCLIIAGGVGFICIVIPNIINFGVNIVLYIIISIFLTYTISTSGKK